MGSFHQHRLMPELLLPADADADAADDDPSASSEDAERRGGGRKRRAAALRTRAVYALDYLGQGRSWPEDCDDDGTSISERGLRYDVDAWIDQVSDFVEGVVLPDYRERLQRRRSRGRRSRSRQNGGGGVGEDGEGKESSSPPPPRVHLVGNSVGG